MLWTRVRTGLGAVAVAGFLAAVVAAPAVAGGWAAVIIDGDASATTGRADEPIAIAFTVLQHGVTPVNTEEATVVAVEARTGDVVRTNATAVGSGGRYRAALVVPHEGRWRWQVELGRLVAQSEVRDVDVAPIAAPGEASASGSSVDPLPALVVGIVGGLVAAGALGLAARAGRRREPGPAPAP